MQTYWMTKLNEGVTAPWDPWDLAMPHLGSGEEGPYLASQLFLQTSICLRTPEKLKNKPQKALK